VTGGGGAVGGDAGADLDADDGAGGPDSGDDADLGGAGPGAVGGRDGGDLPLKLTELLRTTPPSLMVLLLTLVESSKLLMTSLVVVSLDASGCRHVVAVRRDAFWALGAIGGRADLLSVVQVELRDRVGVVPSPPGSRASASIEPNWSTGCSSSELPESYDDPGAVGADAVESGGLGRPRRHGVAGRRLHVDVAAAAPRARGPCQDRWLSPRGGHRRGHLAR
jgi:hypothetical protein